MKKLGFAGVSETALGAQQVSAQAAALLNNKPDRVLFSSACPTVVAYLQKHRANGAALLRVCCRRCSRIARCCGEIGKDIGIVFIGPCIAKKLEAAQHPELLDVALTFEDLRRWLEQEKIAPEQACRKAARRIILCRNARRKARGIRWTAA